jgi:hypothetical protein
MNYCQNFGGFNSEKVSCTIFIISIAVMLGLELMTPGLVNASTASPSTNQLNKAIQYSGFSTTPDFNSMNGQLRIS